MDFITKSKRVVFKQYKDYLSGKLERQFMYKLILIYKNYFIFVISLQMFMKKLKHTNMESRNPSTL